LEPTTDTDTWLRLAGLAGASAPPADSLRFALFDGVGLHVRPSGWTVTGEPAVQQPLPGGLLIGRTPWSVLQADALRERLASDRSVQPGSWSASDSSAWAARLLPRMVEAIGPLADGPPALRDAVTYLRNWNGVYDRASIGATLFDRWMRAYRSKIGRLPAVGEPAFFAAHRQRRALVEAVDSLLHEQGRDLRQWRWERVVPDRRPFPAFSADSLLDQEVESLSRTRYAPVERPGRGHPSTLADGPTLIVNRPLGPSPSTWEAWTDSTGTGLTVRRLQFEPSTFLARPLLDENRPEPVSLRRLTPTATTRLVPSAATETP
jgi:acyl-homoserine lactone acylase PvdQ